MDRNGLRLKMTDDIVTRLRNWHDQRDSWQTLTEAADEIERLRAERDKASALISKLAELLVPFSSLMNKHEQGMLLKAVRGE